jgi:nuclear pore complex protein Nup98-Nup96
MRATFARVALVVFVSTSLVGCSTMSKLAFWRKSDDNTKLAEAPKYSGTNSQLPSAGVNPNNSLASVPGYSTNNAAAAVAAAQTQAGGSSYAGAPAAYQSSVYPTTPYNQAKIGATAGTGASAAGPWGAGATTPNTTSPYASTSPASSYAATGSATTPAYGTTASGAGGVQAQTGFYNPTYDGGTANRYVSGAAIPSSTTSTAVAQATPVGSYSPSYRTADARSSITSSTPMTGSYGAPGTSASAVGSIPEASAATSPGAASAASVVGDRYANTMAGAGSGGSSYGSYSAGGSAYSPAASGSAYSPAASDYRSSPSGYESGSYAGQQTATTSSLGNTGYNPPNAYSTPAYSTPSGGGATSAWPARNDQEYRPGGTSNYSAPAAQPAPGTSGAGSDSRGQLGSVTPASYQTPDASGGRVTATMVSPVSGGSDYYGSYQGSGASSR